MTSHWHTSSWHRPMYTPRRVHIFMRRTTPALPSEPAPPAEPLSHVIKRQPIPRANPQTIYEHTQITNNMYYTKKDAPFEASLCLDHIQISHDLP